MEIQEVEVFIKPNGEVSYEVRGVKGKRCLDLTKELEMDLGGSVVRRDETSEMHETEIHKETEKRIKL